MDRPVHALILPPGRRLYRALAAAMDGSGPAVCPLSPSFPPPELERLLKAVAPAAVETTAGIRPYAPRSGHAEAVGVPVAASTAVLIATSGSTGFPKVAELSVDALRHSAVAALARVEAGVNDRWLCCLPTHHIAGIQVLIRSLVTGSEPEIHPRFDIAAVAESDAHHVALVPSQLRRLLDRGVNLARFRSILLGGAPAPPHMLADAHALGARTFATYGMSESCGGCVYDGAPLDGVRVEVGAEGRIRLAGPVLFSGYRLQPQLTAAARDGDWFVTHDLGTFDNGVLRVRGRVDDIINTGGEKVLATEVAAVLARHPSVSDVAVVGRPDPEWGERVTAVVVPSGSAPSLDELRRWVGRVLPAYAAPRELDLVEALPLLPSGKPDRHALIRGRHARRIARP
ncbi:AMP-binding protein [Streptomyces sp. R11]|uniref:AMP-binding protein n=1 Tax=Streptomyces sp. R11 TaxID=3238625 RepID=A0AB39NC76_9ACTN